MNYFNGKRKVEEGRLDVVSRRRQRSSFMNDGEPWQSVNVPNTHPGPIGTERKTILSRNTIEISSTHCAKAGRDEITGILPKVVNDQSSGRR